MKSKKHYFNQKKTQAELNKFFTKEKSSINSFGRRVNQTFEAYVLASVIKWYRQKGWMVKYMHPNDVMGKQYFNLKFSTRGAPANYTYVVCEKDGQLIQIHHQLRVSTKSNKSKNKYPANICCDVAIIEEKDITFFSTDDAVGNEYLISFAEAKHMSAFAELVASFIGMVHELRPDRLRKLRVKKYRNEHLPPLLYASGILFQTAKGLKETIEKRKYDVDIYSFENKLI